jgi:hypothetical protein
MSKLVFISLLFPPKTAPDDSRRCRWPLLAWLPPVLLGA